MPRKIEISHRTIVFIAIFIFLIWFIVQIKDILLMLFISIILMSALNPGVDRLERWGLPRSLAIAIAYIALWLVLGSVIAGIVPPLVEQTGRLVRLLPTAINRVEFFNAHQQQIGEQLLTRIGSLPENLLKLSLGVFSNFLNVLTTLVITFYLLLERQHLNKYLAILLAGESPARASRLVNEIERRLGSWVRGELILMLAVGVLTYFGYSPAAGHPCRGTRNRTQYRPYCFCRSRCPHRPNHPSVTGFIHCRAVSFGAVYGKQFSGSQNHAKSGWCQSFSQYSGLNDRFSPGRPCRSDSGYPHDSGSSDHRC